jgi:hypothetical protein
MQGLVLQTIRKVIPVGQLVLALVVTVLAVRFAVVAVEPWMSGGAQAAKKKVSRRAAQGQGSSRAEPSSSEARSDKSTASKRATQGAKAGGAFRVNTMLSVKHGSQRSEVYVNSEFMGNTPYAGDVSCTRGESVSVEIVPRNGPPILRSVACQSGPMEIEE